MVNFSQKHCRLGGFINGLILSVRKTEGLKATYVVFALLEVEDKTLLRKELSKGDSLLGFVIVITLVFLYLLEEDRLSSFIRISLGD